MGTAEHRVELPPTPTSAAEARRFVEGALDGVDPAVREIGVLLASELVTNSLLYAEGRITVFVRSTEDGYRVSVWDGSQQEVRPRQVGVDATSGRGLALVEQLSSAWGVEVVPHQGKEVWFEVPRAG